MVISGFPSNQRITISRTGGKTSPAQVDAQGNLNAKNLRDGTYNVKPRNGGRGSNVTCKDAPAPVSVNIADADLVATKPNTPTVNCSQATPVTFEGTLSGTGTGDIKVVWVSSDTGKRSEPMMKFTGPSTKTPAFVVNAPARANPAEPRPTVKAQLLVPRQGSEQGVSSAVFTVTLHCEAGT
ncbi:hypothetical protein [Streptomyces sp. Isolate_45]|uniref:hypothetical protein n=1 Tax=Streptomyces sp. Isolate_45 TaxID=2950111 RepID=UPI002481EC18|nr:hypothetical protein [Streptomyces sp. Isolate_45]MDA5285932.1 hypothetical protein [Streptomyces sp. Isolate_45]